MSQDEKEKQIKNNTNKKTVIKSTIKKINYNTFPKTAHSNVATQEYHIMQTDIPTSKLTLTENKNQKLSENVNINKNIQIQRVIETKQINSENKPKINENKNQKSKKKVTCTKKIKTSSVITKKQNQKSDIKYINDKKPQECFCEQKQNYIQKSNQIPSKNLKQIKLINQNGEEYIEGFGQNINEYVETYPNRNIPENIIEKNEYIINENQNYNLGNNQQRYFYANAQGYNINNPENYEEEIIVEKIRPCICEINNRYPDNSNEYYIEEENIEDNIPEIPEEYETQQYIYPNQIISENIDYNSCNKSNYRNYKVQGSDLNILVAPEIKYYEQVEMSPDKNYIVGQNIKNIPVINKKKPKLIMERLEELEVRQEKIDQPIQLLIPLPPNQIEYACGLKVINSKKRARSLDYHENNKKGWYIKSREKKVYLCPENVEYLNIYNSYKSHRPEKQTVKSFDIINSKPQKPLSMEKSELSYEKNSQHSKQNLFGENADLYEINDYNKNNENNNKFEPNNNQKNNQYNSNRNNQNNVNNITTEKKIIENIVINKENNNQNNEQYKPNNNDQKNNHYNQNKIITEKKIIERTVINNENNYRNKRNDNLNNNQFNQNNNLNNNQYKPNDNQYDQNHNLYNNQYNQNNDLNNNQYKQNDNQYNQNNNLYNNQYKPNDNKNNNLYNPNNNQFNQNYNNQNNVNKIITQKKIIERTVINHENNNQKNNNEQYNQTKIINNRSYNYLLPRRDKKLIVLADFPKKDKNKSWKNSIFPSKARSLSLDSNLKDRNIIIENNNKISSSYAQNNINKKVIYKTTEISSNQIYDSQIQNDWNKTNKTEIITKIDISPIYKKKRSISFDITKEDSIDITKDNDEIIFNDDYNVVSEYLTRDVRAQIDKIPQSTDESVSEEIDVLGGIKKHTEKYGVYDKMIKATFDVIKSKQNVIIRDVSFQKRKEYLLKQKKEHILRNCNSEKNYRIIYNQGDNKINQNSVSVKTGSNNQSDNKTNLKNVSIKTGSNNQKILSSSVNNGNNNLNNMGSTYDKYIAIVNTYEPSVNCDDNNRVTIEKSVSNNTNNQQIEVKNSEIIDSNNFNEIMKSNEIYPNQQKEIIMSSANSASYMEPMNNQRLNNIFLENHSEIKTDSKKYNDFINKYENYKNDNPINNYSNFAVNKMDIIPIDSRRNNSAVNNFNNNVYDDQNQLINTCNIQGNYNNQLSNSINITNNNINGPLNNSAENKISYSMINENTNPISDNDIAGITEIHSVKYISGGDNLKFYNSVNNSGIQNLKKTNKKIISNIYNMQNNNIKNNEEVGARVMGVNYIDYPVNHVYQYSETNIQQCNDGHPINSIRKV